MREISVLALVVLLAGCCQGGLLKVPRVYNALITTNERLLPSRAVSVSAPLLGAPVVLGATSIAAVVPPVASVIPAAPAPAAAPPAPEKSAPESNSTAAAEEASVAANKTAPAKDAPLPFAPAFVPLYNPVYSSYYGYYPSFLPYSLHAHAPYLFLPSPFLPAGPSDQPTARDLPAGAKDEPENDAVSVEAN